MTEQDARAEANRILGLPSFQESMEAANALATNPTNDNVSVLRALLLERDSHTYFKHETCRYVSRLMLLLGTTGLDHLGQLWKEAPGAIYPSAIIETIHAASHGHLLRLMYPGADPWILAPVVTTEMASHARRLFRSIVVEAKSDPNIMDRLLSIAAHDTLEEHLAAERGEPRASFRADLLQVLNDTSLAISAHLIDDFSTLVAQNLAEAEYQRFLAANPVILDPLAKGVMDRTRLGAEHVTDFVIHRFTGDYVLVEIEKPQDPIFTANDDFTAQLTHALGQILDFQEWVEDNIAYASKALPGIVSPPGLLVIGRRKSLSVRQERKLRRLNTTMRGRVSVLGYDDLVESAQALYRNLLA